MALNSKTYLPAYVVVFLDDDLIDYLGYTKFKVASMLGAWLEFLAKELNDLLLCKQKQMPIRALATNDIQIYWIEAATHNNFAFEMNQMYSVFTACVDTVVKEYDNMRLLKIREFWNKSDEELVFNNKFTKTGLLTYWKVMDATFRFNILKRREYLIRVNFRQIKTKPQLQAVRGT